mgnify:CR=1 FL=1
MVGILFVCTGNICRSSTAEGVFRALVARAGLSDTITTASAATHGYHIGEPPDPRTIAHARMRGYDLSTQRARRLDAGDFERFDRILACDRGHHAIMTRLAPRGSWLSASVAPGNEETSIGVRSGCAGVDELSAMARETRGVAPCWARS